ncbi:MAG: hypothetical protein ACN4GW_04735 [Desulforhopalus sp.]
MNRPRHSLLTATAVLLLTAAFSTPLFLPPLVLADEALERVSQEYFHEKNSGRMWTVDRSKKFKSPEQAEKYLKTLNNGTHNDWRLPTKEELADLFAIFDLKRGSGIKIRLEGKYWLSAGDNKKVVGTWEIGDQCGPSRTFYRGKTGYVRAVRP